MKIVTPCSNVLYYTMTGAEVWEVFKLTEEHPDYADGCRYGAHNITTGETMMCQSLKRLRKVLEWSNSIESRWNYKLNRR